MNKMLFTTIFLIVTSACACSPKHNEEKPHGVLTDAQKQTLENAKKTEEILDKANKERMKEVDGAASDK